MQIKEKALYMKSDLILNHNEYQRLRNKANPFLNLQAIMTGPNNANFASPPSCLTVG